MSSPGAGSTAAAHISRHSARPGPFLRPVGGALTAVAGLQCTGRRGAWHRFWRQCGMHCSVQRGTGGPRAGAAGHGRARNDPRLTEWAGAASPDRDRRRLRHGTVRKSDTERQAKRHGSIGTARIWQRRHGTYREQRNQVPQTGQGRTLGPWNGRTRRQWTGRAQRTVTRADGL